jgi:uncharacterized protein
VRFEWDEKKNRVNVSKHGLDFSDVEAVFEGPVIANAVSCVMKNR